MSRPSSEPVPYTWQPDPSLEEDAASPEQEAAMITSELDVDARYYLARAAEYRHILGNDSHVAAAHQLATAERCVREYIKSDPRPIGLTF